MTEKAPAGVRLMSPVAGKYPLLEGVLAAKDLPLKGICTNRDAAEIFGVSVRTIQDWVRNGDLISRNLPGRGRFLSEDLENFLRNSVWRRGTETGVENR
jgi:Helix-turn-helix domain